MDLEKRMELISQVGEEIVTREDLKKLLETKTRPIAYDGFEPSGQMHIAQGLMRAINVNKMTRAGVHFKLYAADWHAWANNKLGGDLEKIQRCGDYMVEVWRACGMDMSKVEFVRASDIVNDPGYWKLVLEISRNSTVKRIIRTGQIMGRTESEIQQASQILYSCMQAADVFWLKADITQLGMDQRKVNVLAREIGPKIGLWEPVVVSSHMLMGLKKPPSGAQTTERAIEMKMSKSIPDTAIFMTDSKEEVKRKINKAYCPEKQVGDNPLMEYMKYIIFERFDEVEIRRPEKFGGDVSFESYSEMVGAYSKGDIHPMDLKAATTEKINELLEPVRKHFSKGRAKELADFVNRQKTTR